MLEGECLDVFLNAPGELVLVAPGIEARDVGEYGLEEVVDLGEAVGVFFRDGLGDRGV